MSCSCITVIKYRTFGTFSKCQFWRMNSGERDYRSMWLLFRLSRKCCFRITIARVLFPCKKREFIISHWGNLDDEEFRQAFGLIRIGGKKTEIKYELSSEISTSQIRICSFIYGASTSIWRQRLILGLKSSKGWS